MQRAEAAAPPRSQVVARRWRRSSGLGELNLFLAAYVAYDAARWVFKGSRAEAMANAHWIMDLERSAHVAVEGSVQRALDFPAVERLLSNLYLVAQFLVVPVVVVWVYRRHPLLYRPLRDTIIATWLIAVPIFGWFPVAPPRLADPGIVDTVSRHAPVALVGHSTLFYNPFAAVPSLHVGFAFVTGITVAAAVRHRWAQALALLWGPLVAVVVV